MKHIQLLIPAAAVFCILPMLAGAQVLRQAGFETGNLEEVHSVHTDEGGSVSVVANPLKDASNPTDFVAKFQTTGDIPERAELRVQGTSELGEFWYGWQLLLPANWQPALRSEQGGGNDIINQWHRGAGKDRPRWAGGHPMTINSDDEGNYHITWNYGGPERVKMHATLEGINALEDRGKWVNWAFHVKWAKEDTPGGGFMRLYHNGELVFSDGGPNHENMRTWMMWKTGIYHGNPSILPTDPYVIYGDNYIMTGPEGSLEQVNPYLNPDPAGELVFRSGFEPDTRMANHNKKNVDIVGTDHSVEPPNNWAALDDHPRIGFFHVEFQGGDTSMRKACIIEDPVSPGNHVMQYWMKSPNVGYEKAYGGKTRIQTDFYYNDSIYDVYYTFRMFLTEDWNILREWEEEMRWFIIAEYWNNAGWLDEGHRFRMHMLINKDEGEGNDLYLDFSGQRLEGDREHIWHYENRNFTLPVGEWIDMAIYLKEGNGETGRLRVDAGQAGRELQNIFDITGFTHHPDDPTPDGFRHLNLLKAYSHRDNVNYVRENGGVLQILWDDLEVRTGIKDPASLFTE